MMIAMITPNTHPIHVLWIEETAKRHGTFDGWVDGFDQVVAASQTPFLSAARVLLQRGVDPETVLQMRHKKTRTDSLRAKVGVAAKLTVTTDTAGPLRFRLFEPWPASGVAEPDEAPQASPSHASR